VCAAPHLHILAEPEANKHRDTHHDAHDEKHDEGHSDDCCQVRHVSQLDLRRMIGLSSSRMGAPNNKPTQPAAAYEQQRMQIEKALFPGGAVWCTDDQQVELRDFIPALSNVQGNL
jgi:hypothetical protein